MIVVSILYYLLALGGIFMGIYMVISNIKENRPGYLYVHPVCCFIISAITIAIAVLIDGL